MTRKREGDAMQARQLSVAVRESPVKVDFSTDGVPEPDRLERWREMSKAVHNIDWYPLAQGIIQQEAAVYRLPGLRVIEGKRTSTGFTARRPPKLIAAGGADDLILDIQIEDCLELSQLGRETRLGPGEAVLASTSDVATAIRTPNSRFIALSLPRHLLAPILREVQSRICVLLPKDSEATFFLQNYLSAIIRSGALESTKLRDLVVAHLYDLVALAVAPKQEVIADAQRRGLAAARLCGIKSDILANLGTAELQSHRSPSATGFRRDICACSSQRRA